MTAARPPETPGAKMMYLIKRQATTTREELIAHWFANHMPAVIARLRVDGDPIAMEYADFIEQSERGICHDRDPASRHTTK